MLHNACRFVYLNMSRLRLKMLLDALQPLPLRRLLGGREVAARLRLGAYDPLEVVVLAEGRGRGHRGARASPKGTQERSQERLLEPHLVLRQLAGSQLLRSRHQSLRG